MNTAQMVWVSYFNTQGLGFDDLTKASISIVKEADRYTNTDINTWLHQKWQERGLITKHSLSQCLMQSSGRSCLSTRVLGEKPALILVSRLGLFTKYSL